MNIPPYFKQEKEATCALACLRVALNYFGIQVSESELQEKIKKEYGKNFSNIWNPTIAKLACEYGLQTTFSSDWPLLKRDILIKAIKEYKENPKNFNVRKYENPDDKDRVSASLSLAYKDMFLAVEKGCKTEYGALTTNKIKELLSSDHLIQTTIKIHLMYPEDKHLFHGILLYGTQGKKVYFHDPFRGSSLNCTLGHLIKALSDVGAFISYSKS